LTAIRPPRLQIIGVLAGLGFVLWAVYQYLLVVYAGTTSGLRLAGLELLRFDERRASRRLRRWRVLASFLSAVSLAWDMSGFSWTKTRCAGTTGLPTRTSRRRGVRPVSNK